MGIDEDDIEVNKIINATTAQELLEALIKINGICADASKVPGGKVNVGHIASISIQAINKATK